MERKVEKNIKIAGMSCAMCVKSIETAVSKLPGIKRVNVNLTTESATIVFDPTITSLEDIKQAIESIGYEFIGVEGDRNKEDRKTVSDHIADMKRKFLFAVETGAVLTILTYSRFIGLPDIPHNSWIQLLFATPVMFYSGRGMFSAAAKALRLKMLNMDVMYSMGVGSAYIASVLSTFDFLPEDYLFFETSVLLLTFLLLGRTLEAMAKGRTSEVVKRLVGLQAKTTVIVRNDRDIKELKR